MCCHCIRNLTTLFTFQIVLVSFSSTFRIVWEYGKLILFLAWAQRYFRNQYIDLEGHNVNRNLILHSLEIQALLMAPITPHWSQKLWSLLGKRTLIEREKWPNWERLDDISDLQEQYLEFVLKQLKENKKKGNSSNRIACIEIAIEYPRWFQRTLKTVAPLFCREVSKGTQHC